MSCSVNKLSSLIYSSPVKILWFLILRGKKNFLQEMDGGGRGAGVPPAPLSSSPSVLHLYLFSYLEI